MERYIQGDISGFEVREAQKSLLDAEERILTAEYNTKLCEISLLQISGKVMHYLEALLFHQLKRFLRLACITVEAYIAPLSFCRTIILRQVEVPPA